jgi:hypothetical protein
MKRMLSVVVFCAVALTCMHSFASVNGRQQEENLHHTLPGIQSDKQPSNENNRILYYAVLVGATMSLGFWLPSTIETIEQYGVGGAVASTHIPRIGIDILTIVAMIKALKNSKQ